MTNFFSYSLFNLWNATLANTVYAVRYAHQNCFPFDRATSHTPKTLSAIMVLNEIE